MRYKMMTRLSVLLSVSLLMGADWFIAVDGQASNPGTLVAPWDIESGLLNQTDVQAGDTVYLLPGTYKHPNRARGTKGYSVNLLGASGQPVTVRPYSGRVTIDGGLSAIHPHHPAHVIVRDLEVIVSENLTETRTSQFIGPNPPQDLERPWGGVEWQTGTDLKVVNCVIHANMQGVGFWREVDCDSEFYGNLIYDNGWLAPDRPHGHGIYTQNETEDYKYIRNNLIFENYALTIQAYGSGLAIVNKIHVSDNILWGALEGEGDNRTSGDRRTLIGGKNAESNQGFRILNNRLFYTNLAVGYQAGGDDLEIIGNTVVMAKIVVTPEFTNVTIEDNFEWRESHLLNGELRPAPEGNDPIPTAPVVTLLPNIYDTDRAHLAVYAYQDQQTAQVDVSGWLVDGDEYELRNPKDFYGPAVATGSVEAGVIEVPLTGMFTPLIVMRTTQPPITIDIPAGATQIKLQFE